MAIGRVRIAHLISSRPESFYGGDIVILNLLKYLDRQKFEPIVVCFAERRNVELPLLIKEAKQRGIETALVPSGGKFDSKSVTELKGLLIDKKIDILHSHGYKSDFIGYLASRDLKIKKVTTFHGWWFGRSIKLRFYDLLDHWAVSHYDRIIAVSEKIKDNLAKKVPQKEKITYIPNGVDVEEIRRHDGRRIRKEFGIGDNAIIAGTLGRLSKEKGHGYLLEAIKDLPQAVLLIVGDGPLKERLIRYATSLDMKERTIFTGFRQDVYDLIAAMDIFVQPSLSEGLPLSVLEAMAARKPIIASNVGGISAIIKDGETGILVKPKDPPSLKEAIIRCISNRDFASKIATDAGKFVGLNFSLESMAGKYEGVYLEVTKQL